MQRLSPAIAVKIVVLVVGSIFWTSCAYLTPNVSPRYQARARRDGNRLHLGSLASFRKSMSWPVRRRKINSDFGSRGGRHEGIDLKASRGEPIFAAHGGRVKFSGRMGSYGKAVIVEYGSISTLYAHNRRNLVSKGSIVRRGDVLAEAGDTGRATGPHLHFEVRVHSADGKYVAANPKYFLK